MRVIAVSVRGILDSLTGEVTQTLDIEKLLTAEPGGVIVGNHLYSILAGLAPAIKRDEGWTMTVNLQQQRTLRMNPNEKQRLTGRIYISRLTYRRAKVGGRKNRRRPPAIKWVVLELGLFMDKPPTELEQILSVGRSLCELAARRGVKPRPSPGSFGSAMLRASSEWTERRAAPEFVSNTAREHLPGNYYAINSKMKRRRLEHVYYMDQESSHHKIASSIPLPHPHTLRARGFFRTAEKGIFRRWTNDLSILRGDFGLLCCSIHCAHIPEQMEHLYPPWALEKGTKPRWIWTPDLRLIENDHRIQFEHVYCALTSHHLDSALWEYSEWALEQRERTDAHVYKGALLAAYGMLACRSDKPLALYSVHGRKPSPRATTVELPLIPEVYRTEITRTRAPAIQNVVARGVIEAETRTRSLEYARQLEGEGIPVAHVYADGLLAVTDQLPLVIPEHWRVAAALTRVFSPHPNSIISDQLVRMPGVLGSARASYASAWEPEAVRAALEAKTSDIEQVGA